MGYARVSVRGGGRGWRRSRRGLDLDQRVRSLVPLGHLHYAVLALPVLSPLPAAGFALGFYRIPGLFAFVVVLEAVRCRLAGLPRAAWVSRSPHAQVRVAGSKDCAGDPAWNRT